MFPHIMTIYRLDTSGTADVISKQIVKGVYWNETQGIRTSGNGTADSKSVTVVTSPHLAKTMGVTWTIKAKDRIIKGEGADVTSLKEIDGYTVEKVEINVCDSPVDNIVIQGA